MWFEMRATLLALPQFREDLLYQSVLHVIATENAKVVAYSKNHGDIHRFSSDLFSTAIAYLSPAHIRSIQRGRKCSVDVSGYSEHITTQICVESCV